MSALKSAVDAKDVDGIHSALAAAVEVELDNKETREAENVLVHIEEQVHCREELSTAIDHSDLKMVTALLKKAQEVGIDSKDPTVVSA
eukprot:CAMPEP_0185750984 /NCGR_PEP_ID=MMETSP1174-20130828/9736_1 /TAXON_ID=35687 /ORGANISM="Dictyocha speculum, Strain CCMP1381" /LENGTH=87 /DNA_ID=CAMNT_0028427737 /DNA_START=52 /DNA_END=311 /DNA_ORIENTATION=+